MATTFLKRQKEMKRMEKQREKAERRAQKRLARRMDSSKNVNSADDASGANVANLSESER